jgi:hypothetical protein
MTIGALAGETLLLLPKAKGLMTNSGSTGPVRDNRQVDKRSGL